MTEDGQTGSQGMRRCLEPPPQGCRREVMAVHDLSHMILAERITDAELGRFLAGCHSALKARGDAPSGDGLLAWKVGLDGLPLFAVRWAFQRWMQSRDWMPVPAEIRELAEMKAAKIEAWYRDCRTALIRGCP